jgi:RimJ/RimL family protein N-acetyltransferase
MIIPPILFDFKADHMLEDEVALLRPLTMGDYENLLPFALNEPEIWEYSLYPAAGADRMHDYIAAAVAGRAEQTMYPFIVYDKRSKTWAGCTRYYQIELSARCIVIGYTWYGRAFQGTGLNKHCKYLLLKFAFETLGMERVALWADVDNHRSIRAMKSIGCTEEGILRSNGYKLNGDRRDSIVMSILKGEWEERVSKTLQEKLS